MAFKERSQLANILMIHSWNEAAEVRERKTSDFLKKSLWGGGGDSISKTSFCSSVMFVRSKIVFGCKKHGQNLEWPELSKTL